MDKSFFDRYTTAVTQADLYSHHGDINPDFGKFIEEPEIDPSTVDVSMIPNSTPSREEFTQNFFSTKYHVVYGSFGSNPYGPGNNVMFKFDQSQNCLRLVRITQSQAEHQLGPDLTIFNDVVDPMSKLTVIGAAFRGGDDLDITFLETPFTYKRVNGGDPDDDPSPVYNIQARKVGSGKLVYNYFVVPIVFN